MFRKLARRIIKRYRMGALPADLMRHALIDAYHKAFSA